MTPIIPLQHYEHATKALFSFTIDPIKDVFDYCVPFFGAWFVGYRPLMLAESQEALMPQETTKKIIQDITQLAKACGLQRQVDICIGLTHGFGNSGGRFSFSNPALLVPEQALFRKNGPHFGADPSYLGDLWHFSDSETRFFLARELIQIGIDSSLLRLAIKVSVVTAWIAIFVIPMTTLTATAILIASTTGYIFSERLFQKRSDEKAAVIIGKEHAISALRKLQEQNLYLREHSRLVQCYIDQVGNNGLDLLHPSLERRVAALTS